MASGSGSNYNDYIPEASGSSSSSSKLEPISSTHVDNFSISTPSSSSNHHQATKAPRKRASPNSTNSSSLKGKGKSTVVSTTFDRECEGLDRWEDECTNLVSLSGGGSSNGKGKGRASISSSWCSIHDQEEKLLRSEFERYTKEIKLFTLPLCISTSKINGSDDLDELELWEQSIRKKWTLVDKSIKTWNYHSIHFSSASPLAEEDSTFIEIEQLEKSLAANLKRLLKKSHSLILDSEDALWLLTDSTSASTNSNALPPCTSASSSSSSGSPLRPPCALLQPEDEEPNPVTALETMKRSELLELLSLSGSHASFITDARKSVERVRIVECLFRRLISRDEELLVKAYKGNDQGGHDHVLRFFEDETSCSLEAITRLHKALQMTTVLNIREAVLDAFRAIKWEESAETADTEEGEEGLGLQLLGGWSYKLGFLPREMTSREWEHVYDLCACPGCAIRICTTFNEWSKIRRLTVISNGKKSPPFLQWGNQKESDAGKVFRSLDIVKCSEERSGTDSEIRKVGGGFIGAKGRGMWVERNERNWLFLKISTSHPKAIPILTALYNSHSVIVKTHSTPTTPHELFPLPPPSHLWYSRHRSAPSKADLRHLSYQVDPDGFGIGNSNPQLILESLDNLDSPEKSQGMSTFDNTYEVLVLDGYGREGESSGMSYLTSLGRSYEQFENEVSQLVLVGAGLADVKKAIEWGESESYRKGDLLFDFGKKLKVSNGIRNGTTRIQPQITVGGGGGGMFGPEDLLFLDQAVRGIDIDDLLPLTPTVSQKGISSGGEKKRKEKVVEGAAALDALRDDALAFKLSRSLFR